MLTDWENERQIWSIFGPWIRVRKWKEILETERESSWRAEFSDSPLFCIHGSFSHDSPFLPLIHTVFSLGKALRTIMRKKNLYNSLIVPSAHFYKVSRYSLWQRGQVHHGQVEREESSHCCTLFSPHSRSYFCSCGSCYLICHKLIK